VYLFDGTTVTMPDTGRVPTGSEFATSLRYGCTEADMRRFVNQIRS